MEAFLDQYHYLITKEIKDIVINTDKKIDKISDDIKALKENSRSNNNNEVPPSTKDLTQMPPRPVSMIGRDKELSDLKSLLDTNQQVLLLNGMGGIGKTELCKKLFWTHYNDYDHIGWIECT